MPPKPEKITDEEKAKRAAEKAKRKAEFEAKRATEAKDKAATGDSTTKSKADLRRERRDQQESQRLAKAAAKDDQPSAPQKLGNKENLPVKMVTKTENKPDNQTRLPEKSKAKGPSSQVADESWVQVFPQIPKRAADIRELTKDLGFTGDKLHPCLIRLGVQLNQGIIKGSTPRSLAVMVALKELIKDYKVPVGKALDRDLPDQIDESMKFLSKCRPLTTGMVNGSLVVRRAILKYSLEKDSEADIVKKLVKLIDDYIVDEISCALKSIIEEAVNLIYDDDTILTFGCSLKMKHVFYQAIKSGKKFKVVIVDSGPHYDGVEMLEFLTEISKDDQVRMSYIYVSALSHVMKNVSKVMIGGHGVLANGYVIAKMGSSLVALVANSFNVPYVVLCETNEFADSVHTDSFVYNESGLPDDYFVSCKNQNLYTFFHDPVKRKNLKILDLVLDVTPPDYVSMIVTERGILPCSAVSAVIRRNYWRLQ